LRERYDEITSSGADVVAIGTGDRRYAEAFVSDEHIPFLVLVDDEGRAARAAAVRTASFIGLLHPRTWKASIDAWRSGHHVHKSGKRVTQLGATFVLGPGDRVRYAHVDGDSTDHAPLANVIGALRD
jgi:peroxiredoxin